ncbi:MAG: response regulator transcription factor, partial [Lachnospiraceae bacterium]|nr:response regulator transcription factor [Lachnospiraceae bacterium]
MAYKILIVDDEKMLTELLSSHLRKCGYEAFVAENAQQTISMLNVYPDLILLDINMP